MVFGDFGLKRRLLLGLTKLTILSGMVGLKMALLRKVLVLEGALR